MVRSDIIKEQVRDASDIVEVVSSYVQLKRRGRTYVGLCPFHNEKTPSFNVTPDRGLFKCFGCGKGGDVFGFLMEMESLTFPEAMRSLAERANIALPTRRSGGVHAEEYERNSAALRFAADFYREQFGNSPAALDYLQHRGLDSSIAETFRLGYAPVDGRALAVAAEKRQLSSDALTAAGLLVPDKERSTFQDRFRACLIFPMRENTGEVAGFGARRLKEEQGTSPYDHSPDTRLYSRRRFLYGLYESKSAIRQAEETILVARYADVLAMHQAGIKNVVACAGMPLTPEQVQLVRRLAKRIVLVHDAQPASLDGAARMINTALGGGLRAYTVSLPQGLNPHEIIMSDGVSVLQTMLSGERQDFVTFLHQDYRNRRARFTSEWLDEATCAIANALANIEDTLMQGSYLEHASSILAVDKEEIRGAVDKAREARALQAGVEFFQDQFFHTDGGARARRYLEDRGIDSATQTLFGLGYAPDAWGMLLRAARARGIAPEGLREAGLVRVKEREEGPWYFDRFRGRIMFPFQSVHGRVVGLRGVRVEKSVTDRNSQRREEAAFEKEPYLYGLYQCKGAARTSGELFVVEGVTDVLVLHSSGIPNVVSPVGGGLTPLLIEHIRHYTAKIVLVYGAGATEPLAVLRDINLALSGGLGADVVELPEQTCLQYRREHGAEKLRAWLFEHRRSFVQQFYDDWNEQGQLTDASALDQVQQRVRTMIDRIADPAARAHYQERAEEADEEARIYDALGFASIFFSRHLLESSEGQRCRQYLENRGISRETIDAFNLGNAPDRWDALLKAARNVGIREETLEKAGLIKPREDGKGFYDRFRGRVVFPIHASDGGVIGFGGRILVPAAHAPKYLNSPETRVYRKSQALYGLYESIAEATRAKEVILVEGYTDVLALHQAGVTNAVACCGTALTSGQVDTLHQYADHLLLLYDADSAGFTATLRAIDLALEGGMIPFAAALPEGEDPDSFVAKKGATAFRAFLLQYRRGFIDFLHEHFARSGRLSTPEGRAEASHHVVASIGKMADVNRMEHAIKRASAVFGIAIHDLQTALSEKLQAAAAQHQRAKRLARRHTRERDGPQRDEARRIPKTGDPAPVRTNDPAEMHLLRIMLQEGENMIGYIMEQLDLADFSEGASRRLAGRLWQMYREDAIDTSKENFDGEVQQLLQDISTEPYQLSPGWEARKARTFKYIDDPEQSAKSAMKQLKLRRIRQEIADEMEKLKTASHEDVKGLLSSLNSLNEYRIKVEELFR